jgi:DNA-binding MarR family transcriptional regulator
MRAVREDAIIRVLPHFEHEFPGASRSAAERAPRQAANLSTSAFQTLAILDGAGRSLPSTVIAERLLVSTASMTSLLNTLERRGLVERRPHPTDGRKILVELTPLAQPIIDSQLPVIHAVITEAMADVPEADREPLLRSLSLIKSRLAQMANQPLPKARAARRKPKR